MATRTGVDSSVVAMSRIIGLVRRPAERGRRHRAADDTGERDDGEDVRDHLDELRGDQLQTLELDLQRVGRREEEAGEGDALRIPLAEDDRGERDEAAPRGHAVAELMLIEREVRTAE